ncbi:MAG: hypothetical protein WDN31_01765 [Hyphomicrobium sp.]
MPVTDLSATVAGVLVGCVLGLREIVPDGGQMIRADRASQG